MLIVSVNASTFTVSDGYDFLTKDKENIFVCVGSNTDIVEIYETSPIENQRTLIASASYNNFSSPTGTTAANVVTEIIKLINRNNNCTSDHYVTTSQSITECGKWRCNGSLTLTLDASVLIENQVIQIFNMGTGTLTIAGGGINILQSGGISSATLTSSAQYDSITLKYNGTNYIVQ